MTESLHIVTQIRHAFKQALVDALGAEHVHNVSRVTRKFSKDNYPLAILLVTDDKTDTSEDGIDTYNITVTIRISERTIFDDTEDRIDAMRLQIERALMTPKQMGFGKFSNYKLGSLTTPDLEPEPDGDAILMSAFIPITFTLSTMPYDPTSNLNP